MGEVFKALADHTRRTILDELADRNGQTLFDICARLTIKHGLGSSGGRLLVGLRGVCLPRLPTDRDSGGDGEATSSVGHGMYIAAVCERHRANDRQAEACTSSVTRGFSVT